MGQERRDTRTLYGHETSVFLPQRWPEAIADMRLRTVHCTFLEHLAKWKEDLRLLSHARYPDLKSDDNLSSVRTVRKKESQPTLSLFSRQKWG